MIDDWMMSELKFARWLGQRNPSAPSYATKIAQPICDAMQYFCHLDKDDLTSALRAEICTDTKQADVRIHHCRAGSWYERVEVINRKQIVKLIKPHLDRMLNNKMYVDEDLWRWCNDENRL